MATIQEVVDYVNNLAGTQDIAGRAYPHEGTEGGDFVLVRVDGTYTDGQLAHLVNHFEEITGYNVRSGIGWLDIRYTYEEVVP